MERSSPFWLIAAMLLISVLMGCKPVPPASIEPNIAPIIEKAFPLFELTGKDYEVSYVSDPSISRGEFEAQNHTDAAIPIQVFSARFNVEGSTQNIPTFYLYLEGDSASISPDSVSIPPHSKVPFWITFPEIPYSESAGAEPKIAISVRALGTLFDPVSNIRMVRRIPLIH